MNEIQFAHPEFAQALWGVLAVAALLVFFEVRGGQALERFIAPDTQLQLVSRPSQSRRWTSLALLIVSLVAIVIALMRPQWGVEYIESPQVGAEIMIALDVSRSMLAEDVAPNRLERAKAEIRDLLPYLKGDQVGLIAFAGRATVLCPLTPDFGFLRLVLDHVDVGSVPLGGTRLEEPIRKATEGFGSTGDLARVLLFFTDGEDHDSFPIDAAKEAAERGIQIVIIGFGDEAGSEIWVTDPNTGARTRVMDQDGRAAISRLDGELLRELALVTEGAYVPAGTGVLDLE
ncbi:MAG: VWA domain-containing protein, partial [Myxococcota bacterium]|nr:VWA domain-containing protein [Myxococcota bacterium]